MTQEKAHRRRKHDKETEEKQSSTKTVDVDDHAHPWHPVLLHPILR